MMCFDHDDHDLLTSVHVVVKALREGTLVIMMTMMMLDVLQGKDVEHDDEDVRCVGSVKMFQVMKY